MESRKQIFISEVNLSVDGYVEINHKPGYKTIYMNGESADISIIIEVPDSMGAEFVYETITPTCDVLDGLYVLRDGDGEDYFHLLRVTENREDPQQVLTQDDILCAQEFEFELYWNDLGGNNGRYEYDVILIADGESKTVTFTDDDIGKADEIYDSESGSTTEECVICGNPTTSYQLERPMCDECTEEIVNWNPQYHK